MLIIYWSRYSVTNSRSLAILTNNSILLFTQRTEKAFLVVYEFEIAINFLRIAIVFHQVVFTQNKTHFHSTFCQIFIKNNIFRSSLGTKSSSLS